MGWMRNTRPCPIPACQTWPAFTSPLRTIFLHEEAAAARAQPSVAAMPNRRPAMLQPTTAPVQFFIPCPSAIFADEGHRNGSRLSCRIEERVPFGCDRKHKVHEFAREVLLSFMPSLSFSCDIQSKNISDWARVAVCPCSITGAALVLRQGSPMSRVVADQSFHQETHASEYKQTASDRRRGQRIGERFRPDTLFSPRYPGPDRGLAEGGPERAERR